MNSLNGLNSVELFDDIDHLLFLCDRLSNRLLQVNSYVDEVKQTWINKRRSIELDSNISPLVAQKVSKCNQVLLNVAEKLAIVELQTESLHNLQSSITNIVPTTIEKHEVCPSMSSINQLSVRAPSSFVQGANVKNETVNTGFLSQRNMSSSTGRSLNDQQVGFNFQNPLHVATNSTINTFTPRNTATLFQEKVPVKQQQQQQQLEQLQSQQQSAFHLPLTGQKDIGFNQSKVSSPNLLISQISDFPTLQKSMPNGSMNGYQQQSSNAMISRPSALSDTYSSRTLHESNIVNGKVRVKMQVIKANTVWHNADIPIIDHPSAFFVCNQDPRVAEQFSMLSIEINNYYNKPANTTVPLQNPSIGDFCVARFSEDHLWYRARVVLIQDESILIVFIDYGNSETKPANEIYPLQESLARLPAMTVACTLAESFPRNENFWTPEATQIFSTLVKNRILEVQFQQSIGQQWPLHFVKVILDGQSITQHPKMTPFITPAQNEEIAMHFNDKLTSMEYILYNVAVGESDIYSDTLP
ncbi:unnamed protein product [Rotaria sordida]|uniref:Tudor domain-containing protein n=1 Tax=Rotaria sordida TaxID=392033 RepID=A0A814QBK1_9BILA|nr:unnamed protein product [Rotaria sordida]CAF1117146.1 unnamed protein product [Rotaria sordida]CAF1117401.1 unnamed protein product [Rotaria sordida]CAF1231391.1 unnamed protein product [Rotaria sordida]CAF1332943.1 unnamed protein product [Rotaria sordida]